MGKVINIEANDDGLRPVGKREEKPHTQIGAKICIPQCREGIFLGLGGCFWWH